MAPPPTLNDNDANARYWFYDVGVNLTPQPTMSRKGFNEWLEWKDKSMPEAVFEKMITDGEFRKAEGLGVVTGKVWRGKHAGEYLGALDCDNPLSIKEFRAYLKDAPLEEIAQKFIIEHHDNNKDDDTYNPKRMHVYFYSKIAIVGKASDKNGPDAKDLEDDKKPAYELKGEYPSNGIMFPTNSLHKSGERYRIIGTKEPVTFTEEQANKFMNWLDETCRKYGLDYFKTDARGRRVSKGLTPAQLFEEGSCTIQGHNRKNALLKMTMSIINGMSGKIPRPTMKKISFEILNREHCKPPITEEMFDDVWHSIETRYLPPDPEAEKAALREIELLAGEDYEEPIRHLVVGDIDNKNEPRIFIEIRRSKDRSGKPIRCVQEFKLIPSMNKETKQKFDVEIYGQKILDAVPVLPDDPDGRRIHVIFDPLFKVKKYKMAFEYISPDTGFVDRTETIGPVTITELRHYLQDKTDFVIDSRPIAGKLNAMIQACIDNGYSRYSEVIGPEGFFWYNDKITSSHLNLKHPVTKEAIRAAIDVLEDMQKQFYYSDVDKQRLAHYLKLFAVGPFEYVRKQLGYHKRFGWTPRGELTGDTKATKSEKGRLACYIWRLDPDTHVLPKRDIDSEARVIYSLGQTTMTLTFQEPDFLFGNNRKRREVSDKILSTLKNSVEDLKGFRLTTSHERIDEHYLAHYLITHNSRPIAEDGASSRFIVDQHKKSDKRTNKEYIEKYTKFIHDHLDALGCLGDFIGWYVCEINPDVLKQDWVSAGIQIWKEMYKFADDDDNNKEYPEQWMNEIIKDSAAGGTGLSDTDLDDQRREMLRTSFQRMFNKLWEISRYEYVNSLDDVDKQIKSNLSIAEQIRWLAAKGRIPGSFIHPNKGICFTTAILGVLEHSYGLDDDRIKFTDLEELCGFDTGFTRPAGGKNTRISTVLPDKLANFINPKLDLTTSFSSSSSSSSSSYSLPELWGMYRQQQQQEQQQ